MTVYPVHTDEHAAAAQQPPAYAPSPNPFDANTGNNNMNFQTEASAQPAPATKQAGTFNRNFHSITSKAGWSLNKAANVIGAEGWWPTNMARECNKAARILHSFTNLGALQPPKTDGPMHPMGITKKSMVKIPDAVLQNCAGLAIFSVIRAGAFHGSLAAGSGVVVARRPDGTWSPPSSFIVSTIGGGFMLGLDVYDCVCVLNTPAQANDFTNPRVSLGGEASIAAGPIGAGGSVDAAVSKTARPMWSYMKSRGLWVGVQIHSTIIVSRADANSVFYNERGITAKKILCGDVAWPMPAKPLFEVLRAIEGRPDFDRTVVQEFGRMASPGDTVRDETVLDETVLGEKECLARAGY
ncbi:SH3 domain-containing protein [Tolypocladium ophioglossoides CBS 100239]|uniref:SH3 domain-containing protein n=1 Tax=Tolypocladium ophioglossoides (strain CBS 100239) TaxID=1163406 RepID=A0A0L0N0V0_TOLOC|nr:SH3 domain-containing protein [Tolypocladium ophioglossoides CBS 100239]